MNAVTVFQEHLKEKSYFLAPCPTHGHLILWFGVMSATLALPFLYIASLV